MSSSAMGYKRNIVHLDMDNFSVSLERLYDDRVHSKPILIGGSGDRGVVHAAMRNAASAYTPPCPCVQRDKWKIWEQN